MSLMDVARRPSVKAGAGVPGYSGGLAAAWLFRVWVFCSRGSLTPVAAPNVSPNVSPNVFLADDLNAWAPLIPLRILTALDEPCVLDGFFRDGG
jgi:hypothetical protein